MSTCLSCKEKVELGDGAIRAGEQQMSKPPMNGMAWHGVARSFIFQSQTIRVADWLTQSQMKG